MTGRKLPTAVRSFVLAHVYSVGQLEVLLLLHQSVDREWDVDSISTALRTNPILVDEILHDLHRRMLLKHRLRDKRDLYRYEPADDRLARTITALAKFYASHRNSVIALIFSQPTEGRRRLADASKFEPDDE